MTDPPGRPYQGPGITVYYDIERCVHFAECVRGLPAVFDTSRRPWIDASGAPAEEVAEVVRRCPSGALHYALDGGPTEEPARPTVVEPVAWGPVTVRGDLRLALDDGVRTETRLAICACGRTAHVPLCDGACKVPQ